MVATAAGGTMAILGARNTYHEAMTPDWAGMGGAGGHGGPGGVGNNGGHSGSITLHYERLGCGRLQAQPQR